MSKQEKPPEPKYDALLAHTAERLASFLGLPSEQVSKVESGLKLVREELAIWTMHDLPRPDSAPAGERVAELEAALRIVGCRGIHSTPTERRNCECIVCRTLKPRRSHEQ